MALNKKEKDRLPATLERSSEHAQATYMHTLEAAEEVHGNGEAAHRIAFGSLKHSFEKVGDHWEAKDERAPATTKTPSVASRRGQVRLRPQAGSTPVLQRRISSTWRVVLAFVDDPG